MNHSPITLIIASAMTAGWLAAGPLPDAGEAPRSPVDIHNDGSIGLGESQDELSADVQQLIIEQTDTKVIQLLSEVENIMDEATERLIDADTGGETIAAQTEAIEKIHAAAKQRQKNGKGGKCSGAMMDMLERMMGKKGEGKKPGQQGQPGQQAGMGNGGDSNSANTAVGGNASDDNAPERRIPKSSGTSSATMPSEFHRALDAYNRGMAETLK